MAARDLVRSGKANVCAFNPKTGHTGYHRAVQGDALSIGNTVSSLFALGADNINEKDRLGNTALTIAMRHGRFMTAEELLQYGARDGLAEALKKVKDRNWVSWLTPYLPRPKDDEFLAACAKGDVEQAKKLVRSEQASPLARDPLTGKTALHTAAEQNRIDVINMLVDLGLKPRHLTQYDQEGRTPLVLAAAGDGRAVRVLIDHGARVECPNARTGESALYIAVQNPDPNSLKILLEGGAGIDSETNNGDSPLRLALRTEGAITLITDTSTHDVLLHMTMLHRACYRGELEQVNNVLRSGDFKINAQDVWGMTALAWACYRGNMDLVLLLIEHGANPDIKDKGGRTPGQIAAQYHPEIAPLFNIQT
jgi:ankyrin repeat protein